MTIIPNSSHRFLRELPSWHNLLSRWLGISGMVGRTLSYTRCLLLGWTMPPGLSTFLWPLYCRLVCCLSNTKLLVWSSYLSNLSPTQSCHLSRVKVEQKKVPYWRWACVLLMRPWQDGLLTRSLPLGFKQTWPKGRSLPTFLLALGTSSSVHLYTRSHRSPNLLLLESRNKQSHLWPLLL